MDLVLVHLSCQLSEFKAAGEEQQSQEESSLLLLNNTLMNVMELTTRLDETDMCAQPAAKKSKSTVGSVIFQERCSISYIVPQSPARPLDTSIRENSKRAWSHA